MDSAFTQHSRLCCRYFRYNDAVVVQSPSCVRLFVTPWTAACQASFSLSISWSLPKFMSIVLVMPSSHLILWHCLLLLPSSFLSIQVFSKDSAVHISWPKYWNLRFSISPSNEYSVLISSKIDWFDLRTAQGTLRSLLQHHNLKATILWCSAFFVIQLSEPFMATGKTIALTLWIFVGRVMSLLFNTRSMFVLTFFSRRKCLLISWLQPPSAVILEPRKRKSITSSTFSSFICHEVMGSGAISLVFWGTWLRSMYQSIGPVRKPAKAPYQPHLLGGQRLTAKETMIYDPTVCRKETKNIINRTKWNDRKICCR